MTLRSLTACLALLAAVGGAGCGGETSGGQVFVTTASSFGKVSTTVVAQLRGAPAPAGACADATHVVGDCCAFPGGPPPANPWSTSSGSSSSSSDDANAGTITVVDTTTGRPVSSASYAGSYVFSLPSSPAWSVGDEITVAAAGDQIPAFTVSGRTIAPLPSALVTTIAQGQDKHVTWAAGSADETLTLSISDEDSDAHVSCVVPASQGETTIDSSLLALLGAGDAFQSTAILEKTTTTETAAGTFVFVADGVATGDCIVE